MDKYIAHWKALDLKFDAIYSGFLGSSKQVDIVKRFIRDFKLKEQITVVDPVLGDDGLRYDTITVEMVDKMRSLIKDADIITPNITEAALLLNENPKIGVETFSSARIKEWLYRLAEQGPEVVVLTSIPISNKVETSAVAAYDSKNEKFWRVQCRYIPAYFPGTGDIFTSVMTGSLLKGKSLPVALDIGVQFVTQAIRASFGHEYARREGVLLESVLENLRAPVLNTSYELF